MYHSQNVGCAPLVTVSSKNLNWALQTFLPRSWDLRLFSDAPHSSCLHLSYFPPDDHCARKQASDSPEVWSLFASAQCPPSKRASPRLQRNTSAKGVALSQSQFCILFLLFSPVRTQCFRLTPSSFSVAQFGKPQLGQPNHEVTFFCAPFGRRAQFCTRPGGADVTQRPTNFVLHPRQEMCGDTQPAPPLLAPIPKTAPARNAYIRTSPCTAPAPPKI